MTLAHVSGEDRRLIFQNAASGVPPEDIRAAFRVSDEEIAAVVTFVAGKIREYRFRRAMPALACATRLDIAINRRPLLETLGKLGPNYLSGPILIRVGTSPVTTVGEAMTAAKKVKAYE
jgi:hypothetical protein